MSAPIVETKKHLKEELEESQMTKDKKFQVLVITVKRGSLNVQEKNLVLSA